MDHVADFPLRCQQLMDALKLLLLLLLLLLLILLLLLLLLFIIIVIIIIIIKHIKELECEFLTFVALTTVYFS